MMTTSLAGEFIMLSLRKTTLSVIVVMMMTTCLPEEFIILSLRKTMPALLIQTTVCQHDDDDDDGDDDFCESDDSFDDHGKVFSFFKTRLIIYFLSGMYHDHRHSPVLQ